MRVSLLRHWCLALGLLLASAGLLLVALVPLRWLRGSEHLVGIRPGVPRPASS